MMIDQSPCSNTGAAGGKHGLNKGWGRTIGDIYQILISRIHLFAQPCHRSKVLFCASADAIIALSLSEEAKDGCRTAKRQTVTSYCKQIVNNTYSPLKDAKGKDCLQRKPDRVVHFHTLC